jgi:TrmH family RNA methyltransferase
MAFLRAFHGGHTLSEPDLSRFYVVLCRAEEAGNVGSACRAMKTMGLTRLVLADCPAFDERKVRTMAVHAADLYENARRFPSLSEALASSSLSAGFTRRRGERRKDFSEDAETFARAAWARGAGDVALVFGNEKSGLSDDELDLCSLAVHIPSSEIFPSLNLAQAVQIACYELRKAALGGLTGSYTPARRAEIEPAVSRVVDRLGQIGFFRLNQGEELRELLRDTAERAALSPAEVRYLEAFIRKTAALALKANPPAGEANRGPD